MCSSAEEGTDATLALNQGKPPLDDLSRLQSPEAAYNVRKHIFWLSYIWLASYFDEMNHQEEPPPEPSPQYLMNSKVVFEESRNVNVDYWTAEEL